jgi:hypothetical protein
MMAVIERIDPALDLPPQPNSQGAILVVVPPRRRGPTTTSTGSPARGLVALAKEQGYSWHSIPGRADVISDCPAAVQGLRHGDHDRHIRHQTLVRACESLGLPHILDPKLNSCDRPCPRPSTSTPTGRHAVQTGMAHLIELGHRRIGFITGFYGHVATEARLAGYRDGLAQAGIAPDETVIVPGTWPVSLLARGGAAPAPPARTPTAIRCRQRSDGPGGLPCRAGSRTAHWLGAVGERI